MEKSENGSLENTPKLLEDLAQVPGHIWAVGMVLALAAAGTVPVWLSLLIVAGILVARAVLSRAESLKEARARAATYANICGPVIVASLSPEETAQDVADRAHVWREQLRLSGNPYAEKIPIIVLPFQPMLYQIGQLSIGWNIYQKEVSERQHLENIKWFEHGCPSHLRGVFASAVLPAPKIEEI